MDLSLKRCTHSPPVPSSGITRCSTILRLRRPNASEKEQHDLKQAETHLRDNVERYNEQLHSYNEIEGKLEKTTPLSIGTFNNDTIAQDRNACIGQLLQDTTHSIDQWQQTRSKVSKRNWREYLGKLWKVRHARNLFRFLRGNDKTPAATFRDPENNNTGSTPGRLGGVGTTGRRRRW